LSTTGDSEDDRNPRGDRDPVVRRYERIGWIGVGVAVLGWMVLGVLTISDAVQHQPDPLATAIGRMLTAATVISAVLLIAADARKHRIDCEALAEKRQAETLAALAELQAEQVRTRHKVAELVEGIAEYSARMEQAAHRPQPAVKADQPHGRRRRPRPSNARVVVLPADVADITKRLDQRLSGAR
jgi:hypothetical protein